MVTGANANMCSSLRVVTNNHDYDENDDGNSRLIQVKTLLLTPKQINFN